MEIARSAPVRAIRYRIAPKDPNAHLYEVSCEVDEPDPEGQCFRLPVWIPGSYLIREFARNFVTVRAECEGMPLAVEKIAKDVWRVAPCAGTVTLVARIYAFDLSVRAAYLDATRGYFNGPSVFVAAAGREALPCEVEILPPPPEAAEGWRVATTLPRAGAAEHGFGTYRAANYDELIDHPVEMASFTLVAFEAGGSPHEVAITGRHRADLERLAKDLRRVCQTHIDLFGGHASSAAPFARYLFQVLALGEGYGGLEHRSSTSLVCSREGLPRTGASSVSEDYRTFLGLASHEYFHAWNVKRIKPAAFAPYDLACENYTRLLWAFEGVTSYYDDLALARSRVIELRDYLELLGRAITTLLRTPARRVQSIADASFDAWIKYYRPDENSPNALSSYYNKGSLVALALDLTLRLESSATLDDLMRALWHRHGLTGIGVPEDGVEATASELAGKDLTPFFDAYVRGTQELPLQELLRAFGVRMSLRRAAAESDKGGTAGSGDAPALWLGARFNAGAELRLRHVYSDGPFARAGLAANDAIVALDGVRGSVDAIAILLRSRSPGERVEFLAFRRDELMRFTVELASAPLDTAWLETIDDVTRIEKQRRAAWLHLDNSTETTANAPELAPALRDARPD